VCLWHLLKILNDPVRKLRKFHFLFEIYPIAHHFINAFKALFEKIVRKKALSGGIGGY
jgi:hypothetical protein